MGQMTINKDVIKDIDDVIILGKMRSLLDLRHDINYHKIKREK